MCEYISENQLCAKGKAREYLAGAEVYSLGSCVSCPLDVPGPHCLHATAIVAHLAEYSKVLFPSLWTRQRNVDKNLPAWYKR